MSTRGLGRTWLIPLAALFALTLAPGPECRAQTRRSPTELELKATYLLNFLRFVRRTEAPAMSAEDSIQVAVVGDENLGRELRRVVQGKHIDGRAILVQSLPETDPVRGFDMVFFGNLAPSQLTRAIEQLRGSPVLTVGDCDDFVDRGGMIGLFFEDRRLRFAINADAAEGAGLRISSNLLSLAAEVRTHTR